MPVRPLHEALQAITSDKIARKPYIRGGYASQETVLGLLGFVKNVIILQLITIRDCRAFTVSNLSLALFEGRSHDIASILI